MPACSSFFNAIENSIRITLKQLDIRDIALELGDISTLSNALLVSAGKRGLPIECLKFPSEDDFRKNVYNGGRKNPVEIVRIRNNICHGNINEFINDELGEENRFFTPECLRNLSNELYLISKCWADGLSDFRRVNLQDDSD